MKKLMMLGVGFLWCSALVQAQEYKTKLANSKDRKVTIELAASELKIEGYNGEELIIQSNSPIQATPERAKGLKPLYYSSVDNSGIGLSVTPDAGGIKIEKATRNAMKYTIKVPRKVSVLYQEANWQGGSTITINNLDGDLEIRTNTADINLLNVTGPVVANSTSGDIKVVYSSLSQQKPTAISTVSGVVDISLPAATKSTMKLQSISGEIYTDFDLGIKKSKDGLNQIAIGNSISGSTNGGGVEMQLNTINTNIYIRKQK
ncbi:DUF4097 family beta strand repeat-containing protein [Dyadobacter sp. CY312]|uniref:DUF4097 family beta strand repeat-containing protein n=1 Tax=Dyadobacter sp. CY312 TaxID=2907303 RepID=UPI001F219AAC|nr:DUF4097 family beta strand repeat-containing protein [Dyadobacter sp. CY312]MCE7040417.1 DUF4097 domain-containing protein [Dyadobacter sp. CY312]